MNLKPKSVLLAVTLLAISGCATGMPRADLLTRLGQQPPPLIIDVRSQGEFERDHLPGALHIPFYSIGSGLGKLENAKQKHIVLYCEHGPRALFAGLMLYVSGYAHIYTLEGHMRAWRSDGFPVEKSAH
jgi:rhodanese-related sulfurtransferase